MPQAPGLRKSATSTPDLRLALAGPVKLKPESMPATSAVRGIAGVCQQLVPAVTHRTNDSAFSSLNVVEAWAGYWILAPKLTAAVRELTASWVKALAPPACPVLDPM